MRRPEATSTSNNLIWPPFNRRQTIDKQLKSVKSLQHGTVHMLYAVNAAYNPLQYLVISIKLIDFVACQAQSMKLVVNSCGKRSTKSGGRRWEDLRWKFHHVDGEGKSMPIAYAVNTASVTTNLAATISHTHLRCECLLISQMMLTQRHLTSLDDVMHDSLPHDT
ncbi:hypothetical protein CHUAL_011960 [Chamberlinius hualienensis]